jgi:hypothetical protein
MSFDHLGKVIISALLGADGNDVCAKFSEGARHGKTDPFSGSSDKRSLSAEVE